MTGEQNDLLAGFREQAHRRRNRLLWILPATLVVSGVIGVLTAQPLAEHFGARHKHVPWGVKVAIFGGLILFVLLEWLVMGLVHRHRHGAWLPEPALAVGAKRPLRKRVAKAFRRGRLPDDPTERALTLNLAERVLRLRPIVYLLIAAAVLDVPVLIFDHRPMIRFCFGLMGASLALSAGLYGFLVHRGRQVRRAAR
jgi:hypothetical protein